MFRLAFLSLMLATTVLSAACDDGGFGELVDAAPDVQSFALDEPIVRQEREPNDDLATAEAAGYPLAARVGGSSDRDHYIVRVEQDGSTVETSALRAAGHCSTGATLEVALLGPDGTTLLAYQRRAGCARLRAHDLAAGDYYLRVSGSRAEAYTLDATVTSL